MNLTTYYIIINLFVVMVLASIPFIFFSAYAESQPTWKITISEGAAKQKQTHGFHPNELPFEEGDKIVWENADLTVHSITSGVPQYLDQAGLFFKTGKINPGESASVVLEKKDYYAYYYFCELHPWLTGKIFFSDEQIAQPETEKPIQIEKSTYDVDDAVTIKGQVHEDFANTDYVIYVYDNESNLVDFAVGNFNERGMYTHKQDIVGEKWEKNEKYLVQLVYGLPTKMAKTVFEIDNKKGNLVYENNLPNWIKNLAGFWCNNEIEDSEFLEVIEYMIKEEIIIVESQSVPLTSSAIPSWIKNNACWWSNNQVSSADFMTGIEYLVNQGTITI